MVQPYAKELGNISLNYLSIYSLNQWAHFQEFTLKINLQQYENAYTQGYSSQYYFQLQNTGNYFNTHV